MATSADETVPAAVGADALVPARLVAGRYRVEHLLGMGGHGKVWLARDDMSGRPVALKILRHFGADDTAWTRREIAALRMLRIPGIVQLLDEGVDEGDSFIVMEVVRGAPFPGRSGPVSWSDIETATLGLLQTLARLHAEGVVHRDLKPDNILVDASGHPTVLDFGIATATYVPGRLTDSGFRVGTPAYLAPEQIRGEQATARTDLYAVGIVIYHALAGRFPQGGETVDQLLAARLTVPSPPLATVAPEVPAYVAAAVDWLLRRDPEDRPPSATAVLQALRNQTTSAEELPLAGRDSLVARIVDGLARGRSLRVVGGAGMGKTRIARELERVLVARGRRVHRLRPAETPYGALAAVVGPLEPLRGLPVERVHSEVGRRLEAAVAAGTILIVDDADRLDRPSARLLSAISASAPVVLLSSPRLDGKHRADELLEPLSAKDAEEALFGGSNRIFHLREDAARELIRRTNGVPSRIETELRAWGRAGLAQRLPDGRFHLDRTAVTRLTTALVPLAIDVLRPRKMPPLLPRHDELLAWIELADGVATERLLAELTGRPSWEVEADLEELLETGACSRVGPQGLVALEGSRVLEMWSITHRNEAHSRLARMMPVGAPARLRHLVLARTAERLDIVHESLRLSEDLAAHGRLDRAAVALEEGIAVARSVVPLPVGEIAALASLWIAVALLDGSTTAIDRVLYELGRTPTFAGMDSMATLARAALAVRASSTGAADLADAVPSISERRLERLRQSTRMLAARRRALADEERLFDELQRWAATLVDEPFVDSTMAGFEGKLRLRQGRFAEAVRAHVACAGGAEWPAERIAANLQAAAAALEDFALDAALGMARDARIEASACRHAYLECHAEYLMRVARYRLEEVLQPDPELVELGGKVASDLRALCSLQEAAVAYRRDERSLAASMASDAARIWQQGGEAPGWVLAEALAIACGGPRADREVAALQTRLRARRPSRICVQATALLSSAGLPPPPVTDAEALYATVPLEHWGRRMAVLSMDESRRMLGAD